MSTVADLRRMIDAAWRRLGAITATHLATVRLVIVDGRSKPEIAPLKAQPSPLCDVAGGVYSSVLGRYVSDGLGAVAVEITVLPQQVPIYESESTITLVIGGMRSGKTETLAGLSVLRGATRPHSKIAYIMPSWGKWPVVREAILRIAGPLVRRAPESDPLIELVTDSTIRGFSIVSGSKEQTSYLGYEFNMAVLEEFREFKDPNKHLQHVYTRLMGLGGQLFIDSSPEVSHPIETMAVSGKYSGQAVKVVNLSTLRNPYSKPDPKNPEAGLEAARRIMPRDVFARDVLGEFAQQIDVDYYEFERAKHVTDTPTGRPYTHMFAYSSYYAQRVSDIGYKIDRSRPPLQRLVFLDFGICHSALIADVLSYQPDETEPSACTLGVHIIGELQSREQAGLAAFLQHDLRTHPAMAGVSAQQTLLIVDPRSAKVRNINEGRTCVQVIQAAGFSVFFEAYGRVAAKDAVNAKFHMGQLTASPKCTKLIDSLLKMKSGHRSQAQLSRDPHGHLTDALKYGVSCLTPWRAIQQHVVDLFGFIPSAEKSDDSP